jgi:preprotein translocase subunit SecA
LGLKLPVGQWLKDETSLDEEKLRARILAEADRRHAEKTVSIGPDVMRHLEKAIMLQVLDTQWKDHLAAMDYLRQGIHLRGYAQKNPKEEYKRESFVLFSDMLNRVRHDVINLLAHVQVQAPQDVEALESQNRPPREMHFVHPTLAAGGAPEPGEGEEEVAVAQKPVTRRQPKIGRNDPCPCGSGKKYKQCHGKLT